MLVGVIADTHDNMDEISRAVDYFNSRNVDVVLHAGDYISPITVREFRHLSANLIGVFGNNDGDRLMLRDQFSEKGIGEIHRDPHYFTLGGREVLLMHQPKFLDILVGSNWEGLIVYGHTHEVDVREGPPLLVNPGECCGLLSGRSTVAVVDLGSMEAEVVEL